MYVVQSLLQKSMQKKTKTLNYLIHQVINLNTSLKSVVADFCDFSKKQFDMFSNPAMGLVILLFASKSLLSMFFFDDRLIIFLFRKKKSFFIKNISKKNNNLPFCVTFRYAKNSFRFVHSIIGTGYKRAGVNHNFICFNIIC